MERRWCSAARRQAYLVEPMISPISRRQGRGDCPERPGYLQHALLIPQMGSGFPRKVCLNVQDWGQVCRFQGKNRGGFGAITNIFH
jgi:hypothetical protein